MKGGSSRKWPAGLVVENSTFREDDMGQDVHCYYLTPGTVPIYLSSHLRVLLDRSKGL